jgi:hypothetical protein
MRSTTRLKKNSSIEIRLPDQTKAVFMERCQREGRTASEVVRTMIHEQLEPTRTVRIRGRSTWRMALAGLAGAALGLGVAAPSMASSGEPNRAEFEKLDQDGDGALTYREFSTR